MQSKQPLILIDAFSMIYRAYYAFIKNPRYDSKGRNTSAIFGFVLMLQEIIDKEQPTHMAVVFDPPGGTFRHEEYKEYKAQREAAPEGITEGLPFIKQYLKDLGIATCEVKGYEADDVVGTLAKQAEKAGFETVYMVTSDKDYGQLVNDVCKIYRPKHGGGYEVWGTQQVLDKFGIQRVDQVVDYLGLIGDSSDNVPGCKGIGPKGAVKLLSEHDSIEGIYQQIDQIKGATQKRLIESEEMTKFSKYLVTIDTEVPIQLSDVTIERQAPDYNAIKTLFDDLEFRTLIKRIIPTEALTIEANTTEQQALTGNLFDVGGSVDSEPSLFDSQQANYQSQGCQYELIDTPERLNQVIDLCLQAPAVAFDTETDGLDPLTANIVGFSLALEEQKGYFYYLPEGDLDQVTQLVAPLNRLMQADQVVKVAHNAKFDLHILSRYGVTYPNNLFDTMIAHYVMNADQSHGLDYLADTMLGYTTIKYEELSSKKKFDLRTDVDRQRLSDYASEDADITLRLYNQLQPQLADKDPTNIYQDIEMPLMRVLMNMEREGILLDLKALSRIEEELNQRLVQIEQEVVELAGVPFNIGSPKQVGEVLFEQLKLVDKPRKTKTGNYTTNEEVLQKIADKHPIVNLILDYREVKKLLSTYVLALPELTNADGKVHTSFNQAVASTGRLSSSNPNLQNIPIRTEDGQRIRAAFVADPYYKEQPNIHEPHNVHAVKVGAQLLSADYSQVELRMIAHLSGDNNLIEAFKEGSDIHRSTAAKIFKVAPDEVTPTMRSKAKTANFGINYGITPYGLSQRLNISFGEAKEFIDEYFATFPGVKQYMDDTIALARERGYAETAFGRRRYLPNINSSNGTVRGYEERNAINTPIQGTAADVIKKAMIIIDRELKEQNLRSRLLLQVHDELIINLYSGEELMVQSIVKDKMESIWPECQVPLLVEMGLANDWLAAH